MRLHRLINMAAACGIVVALGVATAGPASAHVPERVWNKIAECESGQDWGIATGNGYYGGLQFALPTWRGHGGKGMPQDASKDEQIRVAERVLAVQGWGAWPVCSRMAGVR